MNLLICIPTTDFIHAEFVKCLTALIMKLKDEGVQFEVKIMDGTLVHVARDNLAKYALTNGFTHTLWLDADMVFFPDLLDDLMFSGKDFVSGIYHARRPPHGSCIFKNIDPDNIERYELDEYPRDTFSIAGCGFGCVFLSVNIIRDVLKRYGTAFTPMKSLGEDLAFCKRAIDAGHSIFCEPGVKLGHIGHITIYPDDRKYWAEIGGMV